MIVVPASVSNNMSLSLTSIGSDSALNAIVWSIDRIKSSSAGTRRVFIVELMGAYCGYLTRMASIACGAEQHHMHETGGVSLDVLRNDINDAKARFASRRGLSLVLTNEQRWVWCCVVSFFSRQFDWVLDCSLF